MIATMDATALAAAVRNGECRAEQVLDACIARIDATEPQVNAFTCLLYTSPSPRD